MMEKTRVIFMGTPIFAKEILAHLIECDLNIVATVSQPDRHVGRKRILTMTPVHELSEDLGIPCLQPERIKLEKDLLFEYKPDLIITCAYGQIIPKEILDYPKLGCINIHASLLPRLRGGAPIHKAIMYEEEETGITIMEMDVKMDAGDMIYKKSCKLNNKHTTDSLELELIELAKMAIEESLPSILDQSYQAEKQDEDKVTYAYNVSKEEEFVSFDREYSTVSAHIRSLISKPVGYGLVEGEKIKLHSVVESTIESNKENGFILGNVNNALGVVVDGRVLCIDELQPAGKKKMKAVDYLNGAGKEIVNKRFD